MLPVLTSPRGSRKETFAPEFTEYARKTSAKALDLVDPKTTVEEVLGPFAFCTVGPCVAFERTRSAQDLGTGFSTIAAVSSLVEFSSSVGLDSGDAGMTTLDVDCNGRVPEF